MQIGAGNGNRTRVSCLGSKRSATELYPQNSTETSDSGPVGSSCVPTVILSVEMRSVGGENNNGPNS